MPRLPAWLVTLVITAALPARGDACDNAVLATDKVVEPDYLRFLRGVADEHASSLAKQGVPRCMNAWLGPLR